MSKAVMVPQNMDELFRFAEMVSRSSLVPKDYQGKPENTLVAVQWGMEVGLAPLQALQNIAVINGRPSIYGDAALALVRGSGLCEYIHEEIKDGVAICTVRRKGAHEREQVRTFSVEDAKKAKLWGKAGPWEQYPERMLQMRARGFALRDVFPDVLKGIHVAEESQDIPPESPSPNDGTRIAPVQADVVEGSVVQPDPLQIEATVVESKSVELPVLTVKDFLTNEVYPLAKEIGMSQDQLGEYCQTLLSMPLKKLTLPNAKELVTGLKDMQQSMVVEVAA